MTTVVAEDKGGLFTISGRQWLILLMVQLANMLFGMTITIANLVLPQMRGNLSATQEEISWVITLNLVATAVATPMTGWLASRLGWRNLMFFTVLGFTITSLLCGFAGSLETLILARVGQGAFGAPIMPLGQAILLATFPKHLQPAAIALGNLTDSLQLGNRAEVDQVGGTGKALLQRRQQGLAAAQQLGVLRLDGGRRVGERCRPLVRERVHSLASFFFGRLIPPPWPGWGPGRRRGWSSRPFPASPACPCG